jgi:GMP synthase PP-ATPase subunit
VQLFFEFSGKIFEKTIDKILKSRLKCPIKTLDKKENFVYNITGHDTHESSRLEYKCELTSDLEKEAEAFLNAGGGQIHFGVCDDGAIADDPNKGGHWEVMQ